jgi:hypothetical protein
MTNFFKHRITKIFEVNQIMAGGAGGARQGRMELPSPPARRHIVGGPDGQDRIAAKLQELSS